MIRYPYTGKAYQDYAGKPLPVDAGLARRWFRDMLRIRRIELEIERRYSEDEMKTPIHLVIGQEAAAVGCAAGLEAGDLVYAGHRTHGIYLAKGGDLKAMMAELYGRVTGCVGSRGGSMHLIDKAAGIAGTSAIVGGAVPVAAGAALAIQIRQERRLSLVFMGDAATEEGVTSEILNFAALKKLPLVFFCENNFYSVQSPLSRRQPEVSIADRSRGFGVAAVAVDGNNVFAVHAATREAAARARRGAGATFIEAVTYRTRAHGGAGDDSASGYRTIEERAAWESVCPVETYFRFLAGAGVLDAATRPAMEKEIDREIEEAFAFARSSPFPTPEDAARYVYME